MLSNLKLRKIVYTAVLMALMFVMHFTFGYISTGTVEICLMMIPVLMGAIVLGPSSGAILGFFFGLSSFLCCFGIGHPSAFGAALFSENALYCIILCFVPRILMGLAVGYIFMLIARVDKGKYIAVMVSGVCGALLNTVLFMGSLMLMYGNGTYIAGLSQLLGTTNAIAFVIALVGINGLIEAVACLIVSASLSRVLIHYLPGFGGNK